MATYYIGADVHNNSIEMAIMNRKKIVRHSVLMVMSWVLNYLGLRLVSIEEGKLCDTLDFNISATRL